MDTIGATEFKQHCLRILDELGPEGLVITKHGRPVARITPVKGPHAHLIGIVKEEVRVDPEDTLFSTGAWVSDEWDSGEADD